MKFHLRFISLVAALTVAGGGVFQARRLVLAQRAKMRAAEAHANSASAESRQLERQRDALQRELDVARSQLAALPPPLDAAERSRELEIRAWLGRMNRLRQYFKDHPEQAIPELRLLTDIDWLLGSRKVDLSEEFQMRKALAAIRGAAERTFASQASSAVNKYMRETNGEKPAAALALAPFFEIPPDLATLQRYELIALEERNRDGTQMWALQVAAPVDEDHDSRQGVDSTGRIITLTAPFAWIPNYYVRSTRAYRDYFAATQGPALTETGPLIPFFNPPLEPSQIEKILRAEREK